MKNYLIYLFSILVLMACSSPKHVSTPKDLEHKVNGFYARIDVNKKSKDLTGEIIEANANEIKILQKGELISVEKDQVKSCVISVALTVNNPKKINTWASLVNVTSVGHGVFGVITLPINIAITGGMTNSKQIVKYPDNMSWDKVYKFARFPQGIPKNIDINKIQ